MPKKNYRPELILISADSLQTKVVEPELVYQVCKVHKVCHLEQFEVQLSINSKHSTNYKLDKPDKLSTL